MGCGKGLWTYQGCTLLHGLSREMSNFCFSSLPNHPSSIRCSARFAPEIDADYVCDMNESTRFENERVIEPEQGTKAGNAVMLRSIDQRTHAVRSQAVSGLCGMATDG